MLEITDGNSILKDKTAGCFDSIQEKTACALGIFDGVHLGHRLVIKTAVKLKSRGSKAAVFSFCTDTVTSKGGNGRLEQILMEEEKHRRISDLGVDYMYCPDFSAVKDMSAEDFAENILVKKLNCAVAVCGKDFRFGKDAKGSAEVLAEIGKKYGMEVIALDKVSCDGGEVSSSRIRELIRSGEIRRANALLGMPLSYSLTVEHGNELGRTWDFPTINQRLPLGIAVPKFGVYGSYVRVGDKLYRGLTNIGVKPTVEKVKKELSPLAETYIIDFDGDLYGQTAELTLKFFVRPERKFLSFEELKNQIARDKGTVVSTFENEDFTP